MSASVAAHSPRILSLCSGIGGLDLGVRAALHGNSRTVCYVEREAFAAAVLVQRMQDGQLDNAPIWSDLTTFDPQPWRGLVDAIIGGYPCQPFSCAGQRRSENDERWLWPHIARYIATLRPLWCFFENVANHVNLGLEAVWRDLRGMGFKVEAGFFEAAEAGACHIRRRLFILARNQKYVGDANSQGQLQQRQVRRKLQRRPYYTSAQEWRHRWTSSAGICRVAHGVPNGVHRLRALGNAVVPAVSENAFRMLNQGFSP